MKIGFLQFDCQFGEKEKNLNKAAELINICSSNLWVLPELFSTGYLFTSHQELDQLSEKIPEGETTRFLLQLANKNKTTIVAGIAEKADNEFFNSAICVSEKGFIGCYRKIHLFDREKMWFQSGILPFEVFDLTEYKIGIMICFDWIFPEAARTLALKGADIICHPSNLVLPYCQSAMITRCIENKVFAVTANRIGSENRGGVKLVFTGGSEIVTPNGEILARASSDREEVSVVEVDPLKARDKNITSENNLFKDRREDLYML